MIDVIGRSDSASDAKLKGDHQFVRRWTRKTFRTKQEFVNAIVGALNAGMTMSSQALDSEAIQRSSGSAIRFDRHWFGHA